MKPTIVPAEPASRYLLNGRGFGSHQAIAALINRGSRVLDVGCAGGDVSALLQRQREADVVGIEPDPGMAAMTRARGLTVIEGDALDPAVISRAGSFGPFDHIVLGDVLEHVVEPDLMLSRLSPLIRAGGSFVVSIPNVLSLRARLLLARGTWEYTDTGIFDRTHLRFFSIASARALLHDAGLEIDRTLPVGPLSHRLGHAGVALTRARPGLLANQLVARAVLGATATSGASR